MIAIGIDLGGTRIKVVTVDAAGEILDRMSIDTSDWAEAIREGLRSAEEELGRSADAVGVAAPGLAAKDARSIAHMPGRLDGLENLDWTEFLERPQPVPVLNDAQAALLGEAWTGAAQGFDNVFLLTLGTGVGGAVIAEGRLLKGHLGRFGHLGHISLDIRGAPDVTGIPGSLEDAIGECTLRDRAKNRYRSTHEVVEAHLAGDAEASQIWLTSIKKLAVGIASLINILDPEAVILGGGIAQAGAALFDPLQRHLDEIEWRPGGHRVKIISAELGEFAGAIGAAKNAMAAQ
jgi:glucokinase